MIGQECENARVKRIIPVSGNHMPGSGNLENIHLWDESLHLRDTCVIDDIAPPPSHEQSRYRHAIAHALQFVRKGWRFGDWPLIQHARVPMPVKPAIFSQA